MTCGTQARTLALRLVMAALLLLLLAAAYFSLHLLRRLPDTLIYLVQDQGEHFALVPVGRHLEANSTAARLEAAVQALIAGPTPEEATRGLFSAVPKGTRMLGLSLKGMQVTLNLSAAFSQGGGSGEMLARLNQLFYTLTQPTKVGSVKLEVEGRPVTVFSTEGLMVANPWRRSRHWALPEW